MNELIDNMLQTLQGELNVINNEIKYLKKELKQLRQINLDLNYINHEQLIEDIYRLEHKQEFMQLELKKCKGAIRRLKKVKDFS